MGKIRLKPCAYCGKYPHRLSVYGEHKYMCCWNNPYGKQGDWHTTKNGAKRAWNRRNDGEYA